MMIGRCPFKYMNFLCIMTNVFTNWKFRISCSIVYDYLKFYSKSSLKRLLKLNRKANCQNEQCVQKLYVSVVSSFVILSLKVDMRLALCHSSLKNATPSLVCGVLCVLTTLCVSSTSFNKLVEFIKLQQVC